MIHEVVWLTFPGTVAGSRYLARAADVLLVRSLEQDEGKGTRLILRDPSGPCFFDTSLELEAVERLLIDAQRRERGDLV